MLTDEELTILVAYIDAKAEMEAAADKCRSVREVRMVKFFEAEKRIGELKVKLTKSAEIKAIRNAYFYRSSNGKDPK